MESHFAAESLDAQPNQAEREVSFDWKGWAGLLFCAMSFFCMIEPTQPLIAWGIPTPPAVLVYGLAAVGGILLVLGSSFLMTAIFVLVLVASHESLSYVTVHRFGIELHLREIALLTALANLTVHLLRDRVEIRESPVHYCVALYAAFFAAAFFSGIFHSQSLGILVGEMRFALFLGSYPILWFAVRDKNTLFNYTLFLGIITGICAVSGIVFFIRAMATGNMISEYTLFGAFIRRNMGGVLVQTVRPNGVMFFESAALLIIALLSGGQLRKKHIACAVAFLVPMLFAIAITGMRTAYLAMALSLAFLALIALPRSLRILAMALCMMGMALLFCLVALLIDVPGFPELNVIEVSLRARLVETLGAWELIQRHPLLGAGMGASFEALGLVGQHAFMSYAPTQYSSVHNFFLYVLLRGGMTGLICVMSALGGLIGYGIYIADRLSMPFDRAFLRGMTAAFFGQCIASLSMARFYYPVGHFMIAFYAITLYVFARELKSVPNHEALVVSVQSEKEK